MCLLSRKPLFLPTRPRCWRIGIESTQPALAPSGGELLWCAFVSLTPVPQLIRDFEEGAEEGGAIVIDEFDEAGLLDEAAEFDEVAGAGAPVLDPLAMIAAGAVAI